MTKKLTKAQQQEREEALAYLHRVIKPGDTVFTQVGSVSRSGMSRTMSLYATGVNSLGLSTILNITYYAAIVAGYNRNDRGMLKVSGCGMDMGFAVVYSLASCMYGRGEQCAAYGYVRGRNGDTQPETDGGYMLNQQWL